MLRLKRHIVTEIIEVFFAVIVALILIMASFQFAKLLSQAAAGEIAGWAIYQLVALQVVNLFVLITPFAFFISALIALSRLANDNELIAMRSVGFSDKQLYQSLLVVAVPLMGVVLVMTLYVLPNVLLISHNLMKQAEKESELSIIQPGNFRTIGGHTTIFVADIEQSDFTKFFVHQIRPDSQSVMVAQSGRQTTENDERFIELFNGSRYNMDNSNASQFMTFERLLALLPNAKPQNQRDKVALQPLSVLLKDDELVSRLEIQRRIVPALSIIVLALFVPLLIQFNPRENRYGKFVIAIFAYAIYSNSRFVVQAWVEEGKMPIVPGLYIMPIFFLCLWFVRVLLIYKKDKSTKTVAFSEPAS